MGSHVFSCQFVFVPLLGNYHPHEQFPDSNLLPLHQQPFKKRAVSRPLVPWPPAMPASSRPRRVPNRRQKIIESTSSEEEEEEEEEKQQEQDEDDDEEEENSPAAPPPRRAPRQAASQTRAASASTTTSRSRRPPLNERIPPSRATSRGRGGRPTRRQRISDPASDDEETPPTATRSTRRQRVSAPPMEAVEEEPPATTRSTRRQRVSAASVEAVDEKIPAAARSTRRHRTPEPARDDEEEETPPMAARSTRRQRIPDPTSDDEEETPAPTATRSTRRQRIPDPTSDDEEEETAPVAARSTRRQRVSTASSEVVNEKIPAAARSTRRQRVSAAASEVVNEKPPAAARSTRRHRIPDPALDGEEKETPPATSRSTRRQRIPDPASDDEGETPAPTITRSARRQRIPDPTSDDEEEETAPAAARSTRRQRVSAASSVVVEETLPAAAQSTRKQRISDLASDDEEETPSPQQPPRSPQQQRAAILPAEQTPNAPETAAAAVTPSAPQALEFQGSPAAAVQPSPTHSLRLGAPPGSQPQSAKKPQATHNMEPIILKNWGNTLLAREENVEPKKRLVITHLVMNNFKSYAGERMVGPFHPSFTSVVGPNGSGKSNVIDSLLFVFGFRASKMRQGKLSALIHNSEAFPNLDFCEVQVFFQEVLDLPDGKYEIIPESQLTISRRALKNNTNKYYINGSTSDYTKVTSLLRSRGVDLDHKRFLILQGEVESIAQMKAKAQNDNDEGLLEYLEDIIGTSKYKQPIEESVKEVEELNDVCVEKSSRVQHVEKERNSLEAKKEAALDFIRTDNELAIEQSQLFQLNMYDCDKNIRVSSEIIVRIALSRESSG